MKKLYYSILIISIYFSNVIPTNIAKAQDGLKKNKSINMGAINIRSSLKSINNEVTGNHGIETQGFINNKWVKPLDGTITNTFGNDYKFYNVYRAGHTGIDIKANTGTSIHAVDKGTVRLIKTKPNMKYGNYLVMEHENGLYTLYAHLQKIMVTNNETVNQGDIIAYSGISGLASYPHLHFEVLDRVPVRDGAWGYNYICDKRSKELINKEKTKRELFSKNLEFDFLPINIIQEKFSFMNYNKKYISHFYRMKDKVCVEKPIVPITYYNPEAFLPSYEYSDMPVFAYKPKRIKNASAIK